MKIFIHFVLDIQLVQFEYVLNFYDFYGIFSDESCETSSYNSESNDDEEITLAVQAAELASRKEARARFRSSSDLIHRLFVCISGKSHFDVLCNVFQLDLEDTTIVILNSLCRDLCEVNRIQCVKPS